jgi:hypothetical protein
MDRSLLQYILLFVKDEEKKLSGVSSYWRYLFSDKTFNCNSITNRRKPKISFSEKKKMLEMVKNPHHHPSGNSSSASASVLKMLSLKSQSFGTSEEDLTLKQSEKNYNLGEVIMNSDDDDSNSNSDEKSSSSRSFNRILSQKHKNNNNNGNKKETEKEEGSNFHLLSLQKMNKQSKDKVVMSKDFIKKEKEKRNSPSQQQPQQQGLSNRSKSKSEKIPGLSSKSKEQPSGDSVKLLENALKVRSEQQLNSVIEYLDIAFEKVEKLIAEKRKIKKLIKAWNLSYEKQFGHIPSSSERKGHLRELYEEYHKVRDHISFISSQLLLPPESFPLLSSSFLFRFLSF